MRKHKTALITGASGGLGLEFAKILAKKRYNLVLVARNEGKLYSIKNELESGGADIFLDCLSCISTICCLSEEISFVEEDIPFLSIPLGSSLEFISLAGPPD